MSSSLGVSLVWYRNDLRIKDHQGLSRAIDSKRQVVAYFNFNPNLFKELNMGFKKTGSYRSIQFFFSHHQFAVFFDEKDVSQ